ncbi:multidrug MFS transporter [Alicyclobacillus hesperidum subsp. aegles]|uniref:DHA2 family efflux MFS transporter permease subunit n=1 Tax=Alicyclobacillus hesperidum TaxID=89784 RepID=UPI00222DB017|nr:DHA2 family efflux MFS transporter permease subunit [Alicyclobacillus hesperidum]GLG02148.1 multidrug MFS transporter [Alicyclobacillus hesperidum subsp. aegles]
MRSASEQTGVRVVPVFGVMLAGAFVAFLNQTLINVALPQIMDRMHISATTGDWLTTIYLLVNGIVIPITAYLIARFTTRQLYITAMSLFFIGTVICGLSPSFGIMLVGRVVQAAGAGVLMPVMMNAVFRLFPPERRGMAMGIFGIALNFAPAIGPTLSGWIVQNGSWRTLFYIIMPIAFVDLILAIFLMRNVTTTSRPKFDGLGAALSTIGFGGLLYGFSEAGSVGWGGVDVIVSLAVGAASLVALVFWQLATREPILEFRIFRYPMYTLTTIINVIVSVALFAGVILMPMYMQNVRGFSPLLSGLMLLPGGILMGIMSPVTGKLFDLMGARWLAVIGLAITAATTYCLTRLGTDTTFLYCTVVYTLRMFGMSILMMPLMTAGLNELPLRLNPFGTAMLNTLRMVAGAVGTALLVTVMTDRAKVHVQNIMLAQHIAPTDKLAAAHALAQGTVMGINDAFMVAVAASVAAFIMAFFVRRTSPQPDFLEERQERANRHPVDALQESELVVGKD